MLKISRRKVIVGASAAAALAAGGAEAMLPRKFGGPYGLADALSYGALSLLSRRQSLVREFRRDQISKNFPVNGTRDPANRDYQHLKQGRFAEWRLSIDGLVTRPAQLSVADLKAMPSRTQVTQHSCEEGWSSIAEWTGVQLSHVLNETGILPQARYVVFFTFEDDWWDSLDLLDAFHPQTLLAYGMNGGELPLEHGAPLRLRVERQLGYKSLKFLRRILVTDNLDDIRDGTGSASLNVGYAWYAGI